MPAGKHKSSRYRKVSVRLPGGKTTTHFRERKPKAATCAIFGNKLCGVPRERPAILGRLAKTQRRPQRPFGGVLSSKAMRFVLKEQARMEYEQLEVVSEPSETETESSEELGGEQ